MIACKEAVRQLWEYLDGTVAGSQLEALEEHLDRCRRCCAELEFAEELRRFLRESGDEEVPADVMERLNATLEEIDKR
jgi:mycothiol system anti-sigma-R factor